MIDLFWTGLRGAPPDRDTAPHSARG
jgi:hypothetical protein